MDDCQREALHAALRQAVGADLDAVLHEVAELRAELEEVRRRAGLRPPRLARDERRRQVETMRREGLSMRMIAARTKVHRVTVAADLRALGMPTPESTVGIDGVTRRYPRTA